MGKSSAVGDGLAPLLSPCALCWLWRLSAHAVQLVKRTNVTEEKKVGFFPSFMSYTPSWRGQASTMCLFGGKGDQSTLTESWRRRLLIPFDSSKLLDLAHSSCLTTALGLAQSSFYKVLGHLSLYLLWALRLQNLQGGFVWVYKVHGIHSCSSYFCINVSFFFTQNG